MNDDDVGPRVHERRGRWTRRRRSWTSIVAHTARANDMRARTIAPRVRSTPEASKRRPSVARACAGDGRANARGETMASVALALAVTLSSAWPDAAHARLNANELNRMKSGQNDAYAEMMRQMEAEKAKDGNGGGSLSAESLFKQGGGACGDGYELRVQKVLGASCVCVSDTCNREEARSEYERSFGKQTEEERGDGGGGIKFTFATD